MKSNFFLSFLRGLKLPLKLLIGFFGKKSKRTKTEQERKLLSHVRNFAPTHYSYQKSIGKDKKKSRKKNKKVYLVKRIRIIN